VLRGEPGIGKTLLWQIAVKDATSQGVKVLVHRAAEAEAGLADLVEQSTGGPGPRARQVDGPCVGEANRRRIAGRRARRHPLVLAMLSGGHAQYIGTPPAPTSCGWPITRTEASLVLGMPAAW
jgi:hypothetical protein